VCLVFWTGPRAGPNPFCSAQIPSARLLELLSCSDASA
ncbi:hypothetical protein A2U01_0063583, partial [Trifolium medium]|nr:hypothetical protein [Trifolium medium]